MILVWPEISSTSFSISPKESVIFLNLTGLTPVHRSDLISALRGHDQGVRLMRVVSRLKGKRGLDEDSAGKERSG